MEKYRYLSTFILTVLLAMVLNTSLAIANGTISGKVLNESMVGIQGVLVNFNGTNGLSGIVTTNMDGTYSYSLPAGQYKIIFSGVSVNYLDQYYNRKNDYNLADTVTIAESATTQNINAVLVLGGSISGKLANRAGQPVKGVNAQAYLNNAPLNGGVISYSQSDGSFNITGLPTGSYKVKFYNDTNTLWYRNKNDINIADTVNVTAKQTTTINQVFDFSTTTQTMLSGNPPTTATVGIAYYFLPKSTGTKFFSYSYTGTLPPGINFNRFNGELSGIPTTAGTYNNIIITAHGPAVSASLPAFSIIVYQRNRFPSTGPLTR